ncbi:MAG: nucleotidyltransferase domain-containing protein [Collinsella bouchesdurhonensis]|nr:nucleotidyltransferase domain-containing protein [Collinsella bouchesdurhonensis]MEE0571016.1 nucleotidyltransferase domain-containing protein [Collinsella sp.]
MRTLEEARDTLQISQEDIDFLVDGIRRAGEPIAVIAYGSRARGEAGKNGDYDILGLSVLTGRELKEFSIAAHVQLFGFGKDLDFFICNVDDFRAAVRHGRGFATEVARDGVILYGTVGGGMNEDEGTPMEFGLANGTAITDGDIERECAEYESGSWAGTLTGLPIGRPRLSDGKDDASLSFKCPKTDAALIERAAAACGMQ